MSTPHTPWDEARHRTALVQIFEEDNRFKAKVKTWLELATTVFMLCGSLSLLVLMTFAVLDVIGVI